jgi:hypothetical protein
MAKLTTQSEALAEWIQENPEVAARYGYQQAASVPDPLAVFGTMRDRFAEVREMSEELRQLAARGVGRSRLALSLLRAMGTDAQ